MSSCNNDIFRCEWTVDHPSTSLIFEVNRWKSISYDHHQCIYFTTQFLFSSISLSSSFHFLTLNSKYQLLLLSAMSIINNCNWLVVSTYLSENICCSSIGMMKFPTEWKNHPIMFQSPPTIAHPLNIIDSLSTMLGHDFYWRFLHIMENDVSG